jgi:hypothetical protein
MDISELVKENETLKQQIIELNKRIEELNIHLKKYTAPSRHKVYYTTHKNEILERNKAYEVPPEKKKEYARTAYLNKKEKERIAKEKSENEMI